MYGILNTGEASLTAIWPLFFCPSTPQWQQPLKQVPNAKITSWQWPVIQWMTHCVCKTPFCIVKSHEIWYGPTMLFFVSFWVLYQRLFDSVTYNKHFWKHKQYCCTRHKKGVLLHPNSPQQPPLYNGHFSLFLGWPLWRSLNVANEVNNYTTYYDK